MLKSWIREKHTKKSLKNTVLSYLEIICLSRRLKKTWPLEAYERSKEQVNAQHVLIMVGYDALPQDTLVAYNKAVEVMQKAKNGEDFTELVLQYSEEPNTKEQKGNLGYFSAFSMLYAFENAAYNTKVGAISDITRTSYGYHVIKVLDRRPTGNEITVSHIMVSNKNDDPTFDPQVENKRIIPITKSRTEI